MFYYFICKNSKLQDWQNGSSGTAIAQQAPNHEILSSNPSNTKTKGPSQKKLKNKK
jgi:hypothetical protein